MNNFIFENATKTFFGRGGVKEYLNCLVSKYGNTVMLADGGGSAMDCCKAISMAAAYDGDIWDDFWARPSVVDFQLLPLEVTSPWLGAAAR